MLRKESADTQEYESCQLNDMDVDMDENKQELIFLPIAVSDSAGWREPNIMCDRQSTRSICQQRWQWKSSEPVSIAGGGSAAGIPCSVRTWESNVRLARGEVRVWVERRASGRGVPSRAARPRRTLDFSVNAT